MRSWGDVKKLQVIKQVLLVRMVLSGAETGARISLSVFLYLETELQGKIEQCRTVTDTVAQSVLTDAVAQ